MKRSILGLAVAVAGLAIPSVAGAAGRLDPIEIRPAVSRRLLTF